MINFDKQWIREAEGFASKIMEDADRFLKALWDMENFKNDTKEFYEAKIDACNCIIDIASAMDDSFMVKNHTPAKKIVYADLDKER